MWRTIGAAGIPRELVRDVVSRVFRHLFGRPVARRAALVIAQNYDEHRLWDGVARRLDVRPNSVVASPRGDSPRLSEDHKTAIFVGRLVPLKGTIWAIRALARPEAREWSLRILGEGPEKTRLKREVRRLGLEDRVQFEGWLPREQVLEYMQRADAMIAPSMYEGAPFAVAEAVTLGCPVVATRRGGLEVLVGPGQGFLVDVDNCLDRSIARALGDVQQRNAGTSQWSVESLERAVAEWYRKAAHA
jgi:glycosyltransferase involved in cell wall biosynthesis